jgi:hypothetical protein
MASPDGNPDQFVAMCAYKIGPGRTTRAYLICNYAKQELRNGQLGLVAAAGRIGRIGQVIECSEELFWLASE